MRIGRSHLNSFSNTSFMVGRLPCAKIIGSSWPSPVGATADAAACRDSTPLDISDREPSRWINGTVAAYQKPGSHRCSRARTPLRVFLGRIQPAIPILRYDDDSTRVQFGLECRDAPVR